MKESDGTSVLDNAMIVYGNAPRETDVHQSACFDVFTLRRREIRDGVSLLFYEFARADGAPDMRMISWDPSEFRATLQ